MRDLVCQGEIVGTEPLLAARERHASALAELPLAGRRISRAEQAIPTIFVSEEGEFGDNVYLHGKPPANL